MKNIRIIFGQYDRPNHDKKKHREIFDHLEIWGMKQTSNEEGVYYYRSSKHTRLKSVEALRHAFQMAFPGMETSEISGTFVNKDGNPIQGAKALIFKLPSQG